MLSLFEKLDGEKQAEVGYKHPIYKVYVKTSFLYFFYFFFGWGEGGEGVFVRNTCNLQVFNSKFK